MKLKELIDRYQNAMNTIVREVNHILKEKVHSDITTDQFATLQYVHNNKQCTSSQISQAFGVGKSAVTAQINRLYDKHLIERIRDQEDRRIVYLNITEKGTELVNYTEKKLYEALGAKLSHFEEHEIISFVSALEKLAKLMTD